MLNSGGAGNFFSASFAGTTGFSQANFEPTGGPYVQETFTAVASGSPSNLVFTFYNNPGFFNLDDLSVTAADAVATPEPATLISAGMAGLVGLGYGWRRRRAKLAA